MIKKIANDYNFKCLPFMQQNMKYIFKLIFFHLFHIKNKSIFVHDLDVNLSGNNNSQKAQHNLIERAKPSYKLPRNKLFLNTLNHPRQAIFCLTLTELFRLITQLNKTGFSMVNLPSETKCPQLSSPSMFLVC